MLDVVLVSGFDDQVDADLSDVGRSELAFVMDFLHVSAGFGDDVEDLDEVAGAVGDVGGDADESSVGGQAAVDDASDHRDVDVAAAEDEDDFFIFGLEVGKALHHGGEADGSGAFDDHFFEFQEAKDGFGDRGFVDEYDLIDELLCDFETECAHLCDGETVGERGVRRDSCEFVVFERGVQ